MKKTSLSVLAFLYSYQSLFAAGNMLGLSDRQIREWDIHIDDIPGIISSLINFFLGIAGTISVIFVIIGAYKILFGSLQADKTKWRETIVAALGWFALAALSWLIIRFIIDNLT